MPTNIDAPTTDFVIGVYHQLWRIEQSFRMSKHDLGITDLSLRARLDRGALSIVFAALAITRLVESRTGWSIKKFVTTARRYRTIAIQAGGHTHKRCRPAARRHPRDPRCALI